MFAAGEDFDLTFGLMHTAEKSAEILVKMLSMRPDKLQTIKLDNFRHLAKDFNVTLSEEFLYDKYKFKKLKVKSSRNKATCSFGCFSIY